MYACLFVCRKLIHLNYITHRTIRICSIEMLELDVSRKDRQSLNSGEMSFQDLVCDITTGQRQKDVTLPFYFICLLHLANEKVCLTLCDLIRPSVTRWIDDS